MARPSLRWYGRSLASSNSSLVSTAYVLLTQFPSERFVASRFRYLTQTLLITAFKIVGVLSGTLVDRVGRKRMLIYGGNFSSASSAL